MNKALIVTLAAVFCLASAGLAVAADKDTAKPSPATGAAKAMPMPPKPMPRANFSMLYGQVTKVDTSDPANVKLEVKNEADGAMHTVELTPSTNVTKATDVSELKTGDNVRVMARKVDNKEVAMGVMFGKIRKPAQRPAAPAADMPARPAAPKK